MRMLLRWVKSNVVSVYFLLLMVLVLGAYMKIPLEYLSFSTHESRLQKEFSNFGEIAEVKLAKAELTKNSKLMLNNFRAIEPKRVSLVQHCPSSAPFSFGSKKGPVNLSFGLGNEQNQRNQTYGMAALGDNQFYSLTDFQQPQQLNDRLRYGNNNNIIFIRDNCIKNNNNVWYHLIIIFSSL
ncbi:hypothetical protein Patl1_12223 [Pistacia atlantica]|uniref:Uncharacterized protein n=1 Tax=Pistacia atlantica TaxID=434234 RepID=A0ACC1A4F7_9ROSI|nr:hypothetical protein Patl1_12223 [Pistacia atlantica]